MSGAGNPDVQSPNIDRLAREDLHGGRHEPGFVPPNPSRQGFDFWAAHEWHHQHFLIEGSTKRIVPDPRDVPDAKPKLYDVVRDPWEKTNLAAQPPDRIRALTRRLDAEWTTLVTAK